MYSLEDPRPATAPRISTFRKLLIAIGLLGCVTVSGVIGFRTLTPDTSWVEALYMTAITLSTVGYGLVHELTPSGMVFVVALIAGGVASLSLVFSLAAGVVIEDVRSTEIGRKRMEKKIRNLREHCIVCGFGRMGRVVADLLCNEKIPFVVVERDEHVAEEAARQGHLVVEGDATHDEFLITAGVQEARSLIAVTTSDAENVFITLTARQLNSKVRIVARAEEESAAAKLKRAGADRVVTTNQMGAIRMANAALRPTVIDFMEAMAGMDEKAFGFRFEEMRVNEGSEAAGQTLVSLNLSQRTGAIVVGIMRQEKKLDFNPSGRTTLHPGDTLIVIGNQEQLATLAGLLS